MNFRKIQDRAAQQVSILLTRLTPKERKALILIGVLLILGFAVKTLRGA